MQNQIDVEEELTTLTNKILKKEFKKIADNLMIKAIEQKKEFKDLPFNIIIK